MTAKKIDRLPTKGEAMLIAQFWAIDRKAVLVKPLQDCGWMKHRNGTYVVTTAGLDALRKYLQSRATP